MGQLRKVKILAAPDSGFDPACFFIKISTVEGLIVQCSVLAGTQLTREDAEGDSRRVREIQKIALARTTGCLQSFDPTGVMDKAVICSCGRHLFYVGNIPLAVCKILQLPDGVRFEEVHW